MHVVQLAGCEARWMAEGARIAEAAGAAIIDINMGCPARHVTGGAVRLGADARSRSRAVADRGDGRRGRGAGDAEDAAGLGRPLDQRAGACAPRRAGRRAPDHRAWPHALPVLQGPRRLGGGARGQGARRDPVVVNGDICQLRRCRRGARRFGRRRGDGRARGAGPSLAARADRALSRRPAGAKPRPRWQRNSH